MENLLFVSLDKVTVAPVGSVYEKYLNCWWIVHPEKGILFRGQSPQCDMDKTRIENKSKKYHWATVRHIPEVLVKIENLF